MQLDQVARHVAVQQADGDQGRVLGDRLRVGRVGPADLFRAACGAGRTGRYTGTPRSAPGSRPSTAAGSSPCSSRTASCTGRSPPTFRSTGTTVFPSAATGRAACATCSVRTAVRLDRPVRLPALARAASRGTSGCGGSPCTARSGSGRGEDAERLLHVRAEVAGHHRADPGLAEVAQPVRLGHRRRTGGSTAGRSPPPGARGTGSGRPGGGRLQLGLEQRRVRAPSWRADGRGSRAAPGPAGRAASGSANRIAW